MHMAGAGCYIVTKDFVGQQQNNTRLISLIHLAWSSLHSHDQIPPSDVVCSRPKHIRSCQSCEEVRWSTLHPPNQPLQYLHCWNFQQSQNDNQRKANQITLVKSSPTFSSIFLHLHSTSILPPFQTLAPTFPFLGTQVGLVTRPLSSLKSGRTSKKKFKPQRTWVDPNGETQLLLAGSRNIPSHAPEGWNRWAAVELQKRN